MHLLIWILLALSPSYFNVHKVVDGDTFYVEYSPKDLKIRLIGIDAPESQKTRYEEVQYYGIEAKQYLKQRLAGKKVRLEYDVTRKDRYGRTLAYAYLEDGTFINAEMIKKGYAVIMTYPPNVKYSKLFLKLQQEARKNKRGLWQKSIN